jgi:hypothetical protein
VTVREIIDAHPHPAGGDRDALTRCIEACADCDITCTSCADADLAEPDVEDLLLCIRRCLDCAELCHATGRIATRQTRGDGGGLRAALQACAAACRACAEECDRHAEHHEHCRICARVCRSCERACNDLLGSLQG